MKSYFTACVFKRMRIGIVMEDKKINIDLDMEESGLQKK